MNEKASVGRRNAHHCIILFVYLLMIGRFTYSQNDSIKPLRIGDKVPNILFHNVLNYPVPKVRLSDFRKKLIILDFWNLHCSGCIEGFPQLQQIQNEFGNQIQILLVNTINSHEYLKEVGFPFRTKSPVLLNTKLPFILGSDELAKLFPHTGEPHQIWIDSSGTVIGITSASGTDRERVRDFLLGEKVYLPPHLPDSQMNLILNNTSYLKAENSWVLNNLYYSSTLSKYLQSGGLNFGTLYDSQTGKKNGLRYAGDIIQLFKIASKRNIGNRRDIIRIEGESESEIKRLNSLLGPSCLGIDKYDNYKFCYELRIPEFLANSNNDSTDRFLRKIMWEDLERVFQIRCSYEKRMSKCWILKKTSNWASSKSIRTNGGLSSVENSIYGLVIQNSNFGWLLTWLRLNNQCPLGEFILENESGIDESTLVDMKIEVFLGDLVKNLSAIKNALHKYGLDLVQGVREIKFIVFKGTSDQE